MSNADQVGSVPFLVVVAEADPVASAVAASWGTPPATGDHVDGASIRQLGPGIRTLRRSTLHVEDDHLERHLPVPLREARPTLVFPSIHRSRENVVCLTVHPLGNLGPSAEVGGRPRAVDPTDPRAMASILRRLDDAGRAEGWRATYESTHHGPELELPAFFVEIGFGAAAEPPLAAVRILAEAIRELARDTSDRVAMAVGGGHYAPHFTDLALRRRWAFGHIVSRHALEVLDAATARAAYAATPEAEGIVYSRVADAETPALLGLARRCRDQEAPVRTAEMGTGPPSGGARPSGT